MNNLLYRSARALFYAARGLPPRLVRPTDTNPPVAGRASSYVGRFQGVMETAPPTFPDREPIGTPAAGLQKAAHRLAARTAPRVCGFLRVEVDKQKKATGCFLLFSDGQVLTGTVEGSSNPAGRMGAASFRLDPDCTRQPTHGRPAPRVAVVRLQMQNRALRPSPAQNAGATSGEELTIPFV